MFPLSRSITRAAFLVLALVLLVGCAQAPPTQPTSTIEAWSNTQATEAPVATSPASPVIVSATATPGLEPTPPSSATVTTTVSPTAAGSPSPAIDQPAAPPPSAVAPAFGPPWGDRSTYEAGMVTSERKVLAELPGASEYRIQLQIDESLTRVTGQQQVRYTNREEGPLNEIYVRLFPSALGGRMQVSAVTVDGTGVTPELQFENTAMRVPLAEALPPGKATVLALQYQIDVPTSLDKGYGLLSYTNGILALDTPYAPIPVYNAAGWKVQTPPANADTSFNDVSFYIVRITAPARVKLVVTGVEVERHAEPEKQVVTYEQGPARDFFVAASADYVVTTSQVGETRIHSYALPGEEEGANITRQTAVRGLRIYSDRFGPYPYTEFDVAATPMLALGIEYPGTVGVSERVYAPDFRSTAAPAAVLLESTLAHELAHQWFYNLVGSDQIDEPWLDESVTQYATYLYFLDAGGQAAADAWRLNWGSRWDRTDRAEKPVGLPASEYTEREYGSIVYGRGPLFVSALAERMGQVRFDQFLKAYTARFRWGIATTDDFKRMANEACGCDLSDLYGQWLAP